MPELTAERLRELLQYDPETGVFTWIAPASNRAKAGSPAGCLCKTHKYILIGIGGRRHPAHRLAWLYMLGKWPDSDIDHKDGVRSNNRWENLRDVSRSVNMQNIRQARSDSMSGLLGVELHKSSGLYHSRIKAAGKRVHLGYFKTPEEAHAAYLTAKRKLHEGCTI